MNQTRSCLSGRKLHLISWLRDRKSLVTLLLAVGALFVAEAFFAVYTGAEYDMNVWLQTGEWMGKGINIYLPPDHIGYPPLWPFWCLVSYNTASLFGNNVQLWRLIIKLPLLVAQFLLAFCVWKFAKSRFSAKTAKTTALFILTSSFAIYVGALWGQINVLTALLTFLSFYAVTNKKTTLGGIFLGLAVALKIYPIIVLPGFLIFLWKNRNVKQATKFLLFTLAVPILVTGIVFAAFNWDIIYFLKTIFYWAPIYDASPLQFQGGCMNIWSYLGLLGLDISRIWFLRFLWIPIVGVAALYWARKTSFGEKELSLSLISFYILFMVSYSWISEQSFLDPMPFILLQILAYQPKRTYLYALAGIQTLVYAFSLFNGGLLIFKPLFTEFYPAPIKPVLALSQVNIGISWVIRGILGLFVSITLLLFLAILIRPEILKDNKTMKMTQP